MERMSRICHMLLISCFLIYACERSDGYYGADVLITIGFSDSCPISRSILPDEEKISDISIFVFDENGDMHDSQTCRNRRAVLRMTKGKIYNIFAYANTDIEPDIKGMDDMFEIRHRMKDPYDYMNGIPMSCNMTIIADKDTSLTMYLERIMAKLSIRFDRSRISDDTEMNVTSVRIGNCPAEAYLFGSSRVEDSQDCFVEGFERNDTEALNSREADGLSGELSLYMLENLQGKFSADGPADEHGKIFTDDDRRKETCSYIEIDMEYSSDSLFCTDSPLRYRFYIGDSLNSLDVERNSHYHITVCPEGNGLPDHSWRVEKTGLHSYVSEIIMSHGSMKMEYMGQTARIHTRIVPDHAYIQALEWKSSDPDVAAVDSNGSVTATGEGECTISCHSMDGSGVTSTCLVTNKFAPPYFHTYPEDKYLRGDIGDTLHIRCEIFPPNTPFDIGLEYLESDKKDGIYDYILDEDRHGVKLILKSPGSGLIYMEAGPPVNDAELYFIEVNLPS